ncbi:hypothetical protein [Methanobacterium aggregans]|uniref:hypothetical protein n=1 Tax=Methanobacterium aggregans TaxID=1615586 RepID=UPI001AE568B7|nr:hypothetical protein [Methanobacterium aggregans]MBP2045156.1 hypothetical protein [Methanobacterium aggregans]
MHEMILDLDGIFEDFKEKIENARDEELSREEWDILYDVLNDLLTERDIKAADYRKEYRLTWRGL